MTANIDPIRSPAPAAGVRPEKTTAAANAPAGKFGAALAAAQQAGKPLDSALPPTPPAELGAHIAAAAHAWEALAATDRHVSFEQAPGGGVSIQLHDGEQANTLSGAGLFDLIDNEGSA